MKPNTIRLIGAQFRRVAGRWILDFDGVEDLPRDEVEMPLDKHETGWLDQLAERAGVELWVDEDLPGYEEPDVDARGFEVAAATDRYPDIAFTQSDMEDWP